MEIFELPCNFGSNLGNLAKGNSVNMVNSDRGRHLTDGELLSRSSRRRGHVQLRAGKEKAPAWLLRPSWPHYKAYDVAVLLFLLLCSSRRHGRRRPASVPPLLPLLQPSCVCTECRYVSNASRLPSRAHFPVTTAVVSPSPPEQPPSSCLLARPVGHRPPLPMLRSSSSSPRHPVARPPLQLPPTSISRPEIVSLRRPLF